jgi:hypothetical protein
MYAYSNHFPAVTTGSMGIELDCDCKKVWCWSTLNETYEPLQINSEHRLRLGLFTVSLSHSDQPIVQHRV